MDVFFHTQTEESREREREREWGVAVKRVTDRAHTRERNEKWKVIPYCVEVPRVVFTTTIREPEELKVLTLCLKISNI